MDTIVESLADLSTLITVVSIFVSIVSVYQTSVNKRRLNNAFFQFREIHLFSRRDLQHVQDHDSVSTREARAMVEKYESLAAAGMHAIKPYSASEYQNFRFSYRVYAWLRAVKLGLHRLKNDKPE